MTLRTTLSRSKQVALGNLRRRPISALQTMERADLLFGRDRTVVAAGPDIGDGTVTRISDAPPLGLHIFNDACVHINSSVVEVDKRAVFDVPAHAGIERCNYSGVFVRSHGDTHAFLKRSRPPKHIEQGLFLGGNGSFNYYHWMLEILPRLLLLREHTTHNDMKLLVPPEFASRSSYRDSLRSIWSGDDIQVLDRAHVYRFDELHYVETPNHIPFNYRTGQQPLVSDFMLRPLLLRALRDAILRECPPPGGFSSPDKVVFVRKTFRRPFNSDETIELLTQHGYVPVDMSALSLGEQINLVRNATHIAGATGAEWTNLLFARPGTRCLCWMADVLRNFSSYSTIAHIAEAEMRYLLYRTDTEDPGQTYNAPYSLDLERMKTLLTG